MSNKLNGWKKSAIATAAVLGLLSGQAYALSLGRITVLSSLGEPLRAEIEVIDLSAEESASLKAAIASPGAFSAAGLQYNPAMPDLQVNLQRQTNGRAVIGLSSSRLINDPFIDLLIEATWASGRIIRDYTLLFDPPSLQKASPLPPTPAQVPAEVRPSEALTATPAAVPVVVAQPVASPPAERAVGTSKTPLPAKLLVKLGDTASAIALRNKPANVSLDQMLVALLRANPNAFVADNVNRLKTGALIAMPTAAMSSLVTSPQASQILVAQSVDFNEYRRKLAAASPKSPVINADRKASGSLQAKVEDKKQQTPAPDKLTLSKGSIEGKSSEANIASQLAAKDSAARAAEIAKNISDLNKLTVTSNQAAPQPELPASAPASTSSTPGLVVESTPKPSVPTADTPAAKSSSTPAQQSSHSWFDGLLKNPYAPVGALGLMASLIGFGVLRYRQRNKVQSSILGDPLGAIEPGAHADTAPAQPLTFYPAASASGLAPVEVVTAEQNLDLDLNLDLDAETSPEPVPQRAEPIALNEAIDLALPDLDIFATPEATSTETKVVDLKPKVLPPSSAPIAASTPDLNALDFDLGALSLDLEPPEPEPPEIIGDSQDPLETKLALAHEFSAIGDEHGARALIEEVIAEATGAMKTKAERALSQLQLG